MANVLYPSAKSAFLKGDIDMENDTISVAILSASYTYDSTDEFLDDVTGILGTPQDLTGTTVLPGGVFDADDVSYPGVSLGQTGRYVILYKNTGTPSNSPLIGFFDTFDNGSPITRPGDGGSIPILWPEIAARIIAL